MTVFVPILLLSLGAGVAVLGCKTSAHPEAEAETVRVQLCDGATTVEIAAGPKTRADGAAVARKLMTDWQAKNPNITWAMQDPATAEQQEKLLQQRFQLPAPHDNRALLGDGQKQGHPYRDFAERDMVLWERETYRLVLEGAQVFHDAEKLGSTIAVSCDMCHPDASNTHPETYPKYQTQIGKTVLLRHMINWCIEHPLRGKPLAHDDPRMVAMEAYIYAQRKGKVLEFGKH
jgi:hypothetical protein